MDSTWLWLGAFGTTLLAVWAYVRSVGARFAGLLFVTAQFDDAAVSVVRHWLMTNFQPFDLTRELFTGFRVLVHAKQRREVAIFRGISHSERIYRKGWRLLWVTRGHTANNITDSSVITLRFLRGTFDMDAILLEATAAFNDKMCAQYHSQTDLRIVHRFGTANKQQIILRGGNDNVGGNFQQSTPVAAETALETLIDHKPVTHAFSEIGQSSASGIYLDDIALDSDVLDCVEELRRWFRAKQWFRERNIPHRRGVLATGTPGNGKSSLARAIAREFSMPICVMHIDTMTNDELQYHWDQALAMSPCMILIEDIDATFSLRQTKQGGLTFDALLNCIDGVNVTEGILLFITTNKPEELDAALAGDGRVSRPGRIDRILTLKAPDREGRRKIVRRILSDHPELHEEIVAAGDQESGAQFQDRCIRAALERFFGNASHDARTPVSVPFSAAQSGMRYAASGDGSADYAAGNHTGAEREADGLRAATVRAASQAHGVDAADRQAVAPGGSLASAMDGRA